MLRAAVLAAGIFGLWYVVRQRSDPKFCQQLRITTSEGALTVTGPRRLTEAQGVEWEVDAHEEHWGATVERVGC